MLSFGSLAAKIFGSSNDRRVKGFRPKVEAINALEVDMCLLSDDALRARTDMFRSQLASGEVTLDDLLVPAFATVREAAKRALGQRHFDVQLIGGMVLHSGNIAEMKTGEGKTLVATLAVYLNALAGKGVHVVTVNDYLARRDSEWMGKVYKFLGLTVGVIVHDLDDAERQAQYACDVTYATNNELGFDYLRDNMKMSKDEMVQRDHVYAIVDEVDSILIDEARTPLIISGPLEDRAELYLSIDDLMPSLQPEDYELDEKQKSVSLTELGNERMETLLQERGIMNGSLYDIENVTYVHHVNQALKAHKLFQLDKDYIVKNGEVVIIDEFTGRMMAGRRYSEGLHQALEAKERVEIKPENQTLASITFQNYFRLYEKLAGMTGTASTEASEFMDIYGLDVIEIPTNRGVGRIDEDDEIYRTQKEKYAAIVQTIADCYRRGQPILVGTTSIEKSEQLSALLKDRKFIEGIGKTLLAQAETIKKQDDLKAQFVDMGNYLVSLGKVNGQAGDPVPHQVLNARFHEQEAGIVAQAGQPGGVTIATNMAGRGTDIQLGGNVDARMRDWEQALIEAGTPPDDQAIAKMRKEIEADVAKKKEDALAAGGLYVLATERHESRRIDNQLRGRSGRQGDPGKSRFFLSWEDDLMRRFNNKANQFLMERTMGDEALADPMLTRVIANVQKRVEGYNYDLRKHLLEYDDVLNKQRKTVYAARNRILGKGNVRDMLLDETLEDLSRAIAEEYSPATGVPGELVTIDFHRLERALFQRVNTVMNFTSEERQNNELTRLDFTQILSSKLRDAYTRKELLFGAEQMRDIERWVMLQTIDQYWKDHLLSLDHLRDGIGLRGYGQKDPLQEYKREAFDLFKRLISAIKIDTLETLYRIQPNLAEKFAADAEREATERAERELSGAAALHAEADLSAVPRDDATAAPGQDTVARI